MNRFWDKWFFKKNIKKYLKSRNINCFIEENSLILSNVMTEKKNMTAQFEYHQKHDGLYFTEFKSSPHLFYWLSYFKKDNHYLNYIFIESLNELLLYKLGDQQSIKNDYINLTILPDWDTLFCLNDHDIKLITRIPIYKQGKIPIYKKGKSALLVNIIISIETQKIDLEFYEHINDAEEKYIATYRTESNIMDTIKTIIMNEYSIYFLNEKGFNELLNIPSIKEYSPKHHENLLNMIFFEGSHQYLKITNLNPHLKMTNELRI